MATKRITQSSKMLKELGRAKRELAVLRRRFSETDRAFEKTWREISLLTLRLCPPMKPGLALTERDRVERVRQVRAGLGLGLKDARRLVNTADLAVEMMKVYAPAVKW